MADNTYAFRLQNNNVNNALGLGNTLKHWDSSRMYDENEIDAIITSNINTLKEPTSIPSPFARIALAKTAFKEVAANGTKALAAYQKIVSESLDVAEIFFSFDKWKDKIEIIKWSKTNDLPHLINGNKHLYKTLKTFLQDDSKAFNFDLMDSIYILKYRSTGQMIGATSPRTLFFSAPNKFEKLNGNGGFINLSNEIQLSNNHNAFDKIFPLHMRNWEFQKYLYTWVAVNNQIFHNGNNAATSIFNEFEKYLENQKPLINRTNEIDKLQSITASELNNNYDVLRAPDVEILEKSFHQSKNLSVIYHNGNDFLDDNIIRFSGKVDASVFFDGNLNSSALFGYLLPIKEEFFNHYTIDELKEFITINESGNVVEIQLKINENSIYKKIYKESDSTIKKLDVFDCLLFPNVKFTDIKDADYRFGLFSQFEVGNEEGNSVKFFEGNNLIRINENDSIIRNNGDSENQFMQIYSLNQKTFDRIKLSFGNFRGILLPIFKIKGESEKFTFSVDFGTTNTHIEYKTNSQNKIKSFTINEADKQINFLNGMDDLKNRIADVDLIPSTIDENGRFKFPIRTALSMAKKIDPTKKMIPFLQANLVIPYEKIEIPAYNNTFTQLKWESDDKQMTTYIESICFLLRNKVVLNNGELKSTKIVWFYPLSMAGSRSKTIENIWKVTYTKYFLGISVNNVESIDEQTKIILAENIKKLPESIAPYLCYKDEANYKDAISNLVSIDIGGGTTDVVFVKEKKVEYVTSFRFAANSIFGLGEHITPIVSKYKAEIEHIIKNNDENFKLENLYNSILNSKFGDLASFFFSLSENEMLKSVHIDFNSLLKKDENQKLVFVLFYSSIIYHTAQIMNAKNMPLPRHITFSGNGSRIVNIVADKNILAEFSKLIFEKVYNQKYGSSGLDIIHNTVNPKEVTCKGGIKAADNNYVQTPFEPIVLLGTDNSTFVGENYFYKDINLDNAVAETNNQVKSFVKMVIDDLLIKQSTIDVVPESFINALGLNPSTLNLAKEICERDDDLITFTKNGIRNKMNNVNIDTTKIEEPFFFYPIIGLLRALSYKINNID